MSDARHIEGTAANWLVKREGGDWSTEDQEALDLWLEEGFANKAAYWRLEEGWRRADRMVSLGLEPQYAGSFRRRLVETWKPLALAASLALVTFAGVTQLSSPLENVKGQEISTVVGGHKVVQLADGSSIELNTATLIRAEVTSKSREVWLERGEAYFDVLHSDKVSFMVHAGPKTVTVMGTKFSVRLDGEKVTVVVLSGRVRVSGAEEAERSSALVVPAGAMSVTQSNATLLSEKAPTTVQARMAWRDGQIIFRNDTLAEAAAEFNRYNDRKLVVTGQAAGLKIGGSFKASNVDGFARLLRDAYGLNVETSDAEVRVTD